ncbi:hypothetical protein FPV67DRAFT_1675261 [Lyophyllum atratum]|nr:hypothetical protein FPV67DRAFT_1675261 [Lyophyllum atratum]
MPPKSTATSPAANTASKDQYHHFIPRFILRRYHVAAANIPQEKRLKYKTFEERAAETVLVFDIASLTLSDQSLNNVYGVQNLYRDVSAQDVNELEKGLSVLENHAARIINKLHVHTEDDFLLNRKVWQQRLLSFDLEQGKGKKEQGRRQVGESHLAFPTPLPRSSREEAHDPILHAKPHPPTTSSRKPPLIPNDGSQSQAATGIDGAHLQIADPTHLGARAQLAR